MAVLVATAVAVAVKTERLIEMIREFAWKLLDLFIGWLGDKIRIYMWARSSA